MKRYHGKNAWWLIIIFVTFNLLPIVFLYPMDTKITTVILVTLLFYYAFNFLWIPILVRNHVDLYDSYFLFYYGFSKRKVIINKIIKIEKSKCLTAASANSINRIYIETNDKDFMISLKENNEFFETIVKKMTV